MSATNQGEFDKRLKLITPNGTMYALIKGIRRPRAKLKPFAVPFSFCEFNLSKKGEFYTVIGASEIESFHTIVSCDKKLTAVSLVLEIASHSFFHGSEGDFILLLKAIKNIIIYDIPYLYTIKFVQHMIHSNGYYYEYQKYDDIHTPLELLSFLHYNDDIIPDAATNLVRKTLIKIVMSFENKFDCKINSQKSI